MTTIEKITREAEAAGATAVGTYRTPESILVAVAVDEGEELWHLGEYKTLISAAKKVAADVRQLIALPVEQRQRATWWIDSERDPREIELLQELRRQTIRLDNSIEPDGRGDWDDAPIAAMAVDLGIAANELINHLILRGVLYAPEKAPR